MVDTVTFNSTGAAPPSGTIMVTDEISFGGTTGHVQFVKLMQGTLDSTAPISTASPLPVLLQSSTATVTIQGNASVAISGNSTAVLSTAGMGGTTAIPMFVAAIPNIHQLYDGAANPVRPQYSSINVTVSGIATIIASTTGSIIVLAAQFSAKTSCTVQWFEATTSGITGVQSLAGDGGFVLPFNPAGWFQTSTGKLLAMGVQGSSGGVGGSLTYCVTPTT